MLKQKNEVIVVSLGHCQETGTRINNSLSGVESIDVGTSVRSACEVYSPPSRCRRIVNCGVLSQIANVGRWIDVANLDLGLVFNSRKLEAYNW